MKNSLKESAIAGMHVRPVERLPCVCFASARGMANNIITRIKMVEHKLKRNKKQEHNKSSSLRRKRCVTLVSGI